ncbi:MAG: PhnD/SsuA/transferrin family substrate-binding protein [Actinomycetota bacterium]|nr:PhnD/SsuA/transferrin family substrate-binding protein [Actinomycetota bacterium]
MSSPASVASLAMYPFAALREATDQLWEAVRRHLGWGPAALEWDILTPDVWFHPELLLAQTCGWPLVTQFADSMGVVGAFDHDVPDAHDGTYRSALVSSIDATLDDLRDRPGVVAAVNGRDSLSGWVSLVYAWGGVPTDVIETGAHVESVRAVADRRAHVASIDAVSWALLGDLEPALVEGLHLVGAGPRVPCLPVVVPAARVGHVDALRAAFTAAVAEPDLAGSLAVLRIRGFVPLDLADYLPLRALLS